MLRRTLCLSPPRRAMPAPEHPPSAAADLSTHSRPWARLADWLRALRRSAIATVTPEGSTPAGSGAPAVNGSREAVTAPSPWEDFAEWEAYDLMVPRVDIVALDLEDSREDLLATIRQHPFNCFPVYRKTLDDTLGFVRVKRLFDALASGQPLDWLVLVEKPVFAVASTRAPELMGNMYRQGVPLALVVDEYGGIDGLVSMGDFVEILCAGPQMTSGESRRQREKAYNQPQVFDARMELDAFERELGYPIQLEDGVRDEIDTIGGLVFYITSKVPKRGDLIAVDEALQLEVLDADPRRVKTVRAYLKRGVEAVA
jgi:magnesium and cobalt transporter